MDLSRHRYTNEEIEAWRQEHHRAGYFNPDDSRIFVPKGYGVGITVNWGNPLTFIVVIAFVAIIVLVKILVGKH